MITSNERAAVACDMLLTSLMKIQMMMPYRQMGETIFSCKEEGIRAEQIVRDWAKEYANPECEDDVLIKDVLERILDYIYLKAPGLRPGEGGASG